MIRIARSPSYRLGWKAATDAMAKEARTGNQRVESEETLRARIRVGHLTPEFVEGYLDSVRHHG